MSSLAEINLNEWSCEVANRWWLELLTVKMIFFFILISHLILANNLTSCNWYQMLVSSKQMKKNQQDFSFAAIKEKSLIKNDGILLHIQN